MARRKSPSGFGWTQPKKESKQPAPRNLAHETSLCGAIRGRLLVRLRYDDDVLDRLFAPYAVYRSANDKVLVTGVQIENPAEPIERFEPRNLEVGKITALEITDSTFIPDRRFNLHDDKYQNGFICRF